MLCDAGEHPRADLLAFVKGKDKVRPPFAGKDAVGAAGFALDAPADAQEGGQHPPGFGRTPTGSYCHGKNGRKFVGHLAMIEPVRENTQRERLSSGDGFLSAGTVCHHAGNARDFGEPAPIAFLLGFNGEIHFANVCGPAGKTRRELQGCGHAASRSQPANS